jgi:O-acetylserine/cysteine efflux transporter
LYPPLPALAISFAIDGPGGLWLSLTQASWTGIAAPFYLGILASVFAYAVWGGLLQRYSTGAVAPFALLSPCVGAITSAIVFGEEFGLQRVGGIVFMLVGLAIVAVPLQRRGFQRRRALKQPVG